MISLHGSSNNTQYFDIISSFLLSDTDFLSDIFSTKPSYWLTTNVMFIFLLLTEINFSTLVFNLSGCIRRFMVD